MGQRFGEWEDTEDTEDTEDAEDAESCSGVFNVIAHKSTRYLPAGGSNRRIFWSIRIGSLIAGDLTMALAGSAEINALTGRIIGCAIRVHRRFGPGLFEKPCTRAMALELAKNQLQYDAEVSVRATYDDRDIGVGYKMDFVVESMVIVEIKAVARLLPVHRQQLTTYLKLSGYPAGLLINFNVPVLKQGIVRVLNEKRLKT